MIFEQVLELIPTQSLRHPIIIILSLLIPPPFKPHESMSSISSLEILESRNLGNTREHTGIRPRSHTI